MSGGKKPTWQRSRDVDRSDSGYTTQTDMESRGKLAGAEDPSAFGPPLGPPQQASTKPTTAPININSGVGTGARFIQLCYYILYKLSLSKCSDSIAVG